MNINLYTDGASRNNPGPSSVAFVIDGEHLDGRKWFYICAKFLSEKRTNNFAEWTAVLNGVKHISYTKSQEKNLVTLKIFSDSLHVVNGLNGSYKIKEERLLKIKNQICSIFKSFNSVELIHIKRDTHKYNKLCDEMCNIILDKVDLG